MIPARKTSPARKMSDEDFEKKQLAQCDKLATMSAQDEIILAGMALAPATLPAVRQDVVQSLLDSAMLKSSTLVLTLAEQKALVADFDDSCFQRGANGDNNLIYLEHKFLQDRLNDVVGAGQYKKQIVKDWNEKFTVPAKNGKPAYEATRIYIRMVLLVRGIAVGEGIGEAEYYPTNASGSYGKSFESAKTAAFRLCMKDFGCGLQPYSKEFCENWKAKYPGFERPKK